MIENIKRIGLFMIAAQAVMHFTAGQQYEKYMRIITGIVVLLLFITSFSSYKGSAVDTWQRELEQIMEKMESCDNMWPEKMSDADFGSGRSVIQQLEDEMKRKLSEEADLDEYEIADVTIEREEERKSGAAQGIVSGRIRITLRQKAEYDEIRADKGTENPVVSIERIQIGAQPGVDVQETEGAEDLQEYRGIFAGILETEEERVEVIYDGRG